MKMLDYGTARYVRCIRASMFSSTGTVRLIYCRADRLPNGEHTLNDDRDVSHTIFSRSGGAIGRTLILPPSFDGALEPVPVRAY